MVNLTGGGRSRGRHDASVTLTLASLSGTAWNHHDDMELALSTEGKVILGGEVVTAPGMPDAIVAVMYLPPLRLFVATDTAHRICVIRTP